MKILSLSWLALFIAGVFKSAYGDNRLSSGFQPVEINIQLAQDIRMDSVYVYFINSLKGETVIDSVAEFKAQGTGLFKYRGWTKGGGQLIIRAKPTTGGKIKHRHLPITPAFYWQAQDRVHIRMTKRTALPLTGNMMDDYVFAFSGAGSVKYMAREKVLRARLNAEPAPTSAMNHPYQDLLAPKVDAALKTLEELKPELSDHYYHLLKADIIGWQAGRFRRLTGVCENGLDSAACLISYRQNLHTAFDSAAMEIPPAIAALSFPYVTYLHEKLLFESSLGRMEDLRPDYVSTIVKEHQGPLRERLLLNLFLNHPPGADINLMYQKARVLISDPDYLTALDEATRMLPGIPVKELELQDLSGKMIRLADLKGKVAFVDVWFTGCGACAAYYRNVLREAEEVLKDQNDVVFVSISTDNNRELWKRSVSSGKYSSPDVVNLCTGGSEHPWVKYYNFESVPKMIIVNREGQIERIYNNGLADGINTTAALMSTLKKTQQAQ
jgi:cytochrome oxidase Cu insertion factor (SCO1/SenC/PrrC family)